MPRSVRQGFPILSYDGLGDNPTISIREPQQIVNNVLPVASLEGTTMTPALVVQRQRSLGREPYRESAQFAPIKGIIAATLLSLLVFWLPLFVAVSLYRF